jgi:hypothetical protein
MDLENLNTTEPQTPESGLNQDGMVTGHCIQRFINPAVAVSLSKFNQKISTLIF